MPGLWEELVLLMSALHARVKLSLAWMYVSDLVNHVDFGRMVDGKGGSYPTANVAGWLGHVASIIHDPGVMEHCPAGCAAVVAALSSAGYEIKKEANA